MLSNIFQKLTNYFREIYISSLKSFVINTDPKELKEETLLDLPKELRDKLDVCVNVHIGLKNKIYEEKQQWNDVIEETSGQSKELKDRIYKTLAHEPAKEQVRYYNKVIKQIDSNKKLYLVGFDKELATREAKLELLKMGFEPADILETVLFFQEYKNTINRYLPIIILDAYFDFDKNIRLKVDNLYSMSIYFDSENVKFGRISNIEWREFDGARFLKKINFLVKLI